jgi:hypothetical protein
MTGVDALIAQLNDAPAAVAVDHAAEVFAETGETAAALADRDGYDVATLWWAAGALTRAYTALLPHTSTDPPSSPPSPGALAHDPDRLDELLRAAIGALDRAARAAEEPERIYALTRAADLADQARRACANARAAGR